MEKHRRHFFWVGKKKKTEYYMVKWNKGCCFNVKGPESERCEKRKYQLALQVAVEVCRRGETTDAIGRLKLGPMDAGDTGEGLCVGTNTHKHTHIHGLPRFGALVRR